MHQTTLDAEDPAEPVRRWLGEADVGVSGRRGRSARALRAGSQNQPHGACHVVHASIVEAAHGCDKPPLAWSQLRLGARLLPFSEQGVQTDAERIGESPGKLDAWHEPAPLDATDGRVGRIGGLSEFRLREATLMAKVPNVFADACALLIGRHLPRTADIAAVQEERIRRSSA